MSICQSKKWVEFDRQIRKDLGLDQFTSSNQDFDMFVKERNDSNRYADFFPFRLRVCTLLLVD
jgi:hypothetical protein